jgi:hypothetical protein
MIIWLKVVMGFIIARLAKIEYSTLKTDIMALYRQVSFLILLNTHKDKKIKKYVKQGRISILVITLIIVVFIIL